MSHDTETKAPIAAGDILALDTIVAPFVMLVEGTDDDFTHPAGYGTRVWFRWLAHPDASKETTRECIWESQLQDSAWLKVA